MNASFQSAGKLLLAAGVGLAVIGLLLIAVDRSGGLPRVPGDFVLRKKNLTVYLPIGTSILLSCLLSFILWFLNRR